MMLSHAWVEGPAMEHLHCGGRSRGVTHPSPHDVPPVYLANTAMTPHRDHPLAVLETFDVSAARQPGPGMRFRRNATGELFSVVYGTDLVCKLTSLDTVPGCDFEEIVTHRRLQAEYTPVTVRVGDRVDPQHW